MGFVANQAVVRDAAHVFRAQLAGALHSIATDILNEPIETADHARRLTWARMVTADADAAANEAAKWVAMMLTNATFAANPTTADDGAVKTVAISFLPTMLVR